MNRIRPLLSLAAFVLALALAPYDAHAAGIAEIVTRALDHDPRLSAAAAAVDQADAGVDAARAGYRPRVAVTASAGRADVDAQAPFPPSGDRSPASAALQVSQPLYTFGRTAGAVSAAVAELDAQRAAEEATRQQLIFDSARAYLDILRDRGEAELNRSNLEVLTELAAHVRAQQAVGQLTATDVAQAQSRRAAAEAALRLAEARLASSRAGLRRLLGEQPPALDQDWPLPPVPATLGEAQSLADAHPTLRAAAARSEAAAAHRDAARAARRPLLSLQARAAHDYDSQFIPGSVDTWSMLLQVDVPLYEGGRLGAQARGAGALRERALAELADARAAVHETVERAWEQLQAATAVLDTVAAQIDAASLALKGVRAEAEVGQRTTLDVLDAERELLAARVAELRARRDRSVAALALRGAIGDLAVDDLRK